MLNWRRDPDDEERKMQHEWRMKQLEYDILRVRSDKEQIENNILRVRSDYERIENEILQVRNDSERIESETEQLRQENAKLRLHNAKMQTLLSCVDQLCFPPESSSILPAPTEPDCKPSSP